MINIEPLPFDRFEENIPALARVLLDAVESGASVGFTTPFDHAAAADWWRSQTPQVATGDLKIWIARTANEIVATVCLATPPKPNSRHRAEVVKLIVTQKARGQGLGKTMLETAEQAARKSGATLLVLDTESDTPADHLYKSTGWTHYGTVPNYATTPTGTPKPCNFYYKPLS